MSECVMNRDLNIIMFELLFWNKYSEAVMKKKARLHKRGCNVILRWTNTSIDFVIKYEQKPDPQRF